MNEKNLIGILGCIGFLIISFTPVIPLMLHHYGIESMIAVKAFVGIFSLVCGYAIIYGFFKKERPDGSKKEGKIRIRMIMMMIGIIIILLAWFSNIPVWLSNISGLGETFDFGGETGISGGIGVRIFTSILTAVGILICRFSIKREKQVIAKMAPEERTIRHAYGGEDNY